jgi:hypothetical protein
MECVMPKSSLEELRGQIAAGEYAIESSALAGDILAKFAVIRRVGRRLRSEDAEGAATDGRGAPQTRRSRGPQPAPSRPHRSRDERLP